MRNNFLAYIVVFALFTPSISRAAGAAKAEAGAASEKPIKALLILGGCCHDYAKQKDILKTGIEARANVEITIAYDPDSTDKHLNPVYKDPDWAKGFDVIIHDECSAYMTDLDIVDRILKPHREGLPAIVLHCGIHSYRTQGWPEKDTPWFEFTGVVSNFHRKQLPIAVTYVDQDHPITRGMKDWTTVNEELYNNLRPLLPTAHALAKGKQGADEDVVIWTNGYGEKKTRVFGTTLGHNNDTVADTKYLDLVTRGLLWSVDKLDDKHLKPAKAAAKPDMKGDKTAVAVATPDTGCDCENVETK